MNAFFVFAAVFAHIGLVIVAPHLRKQTAALIAAYCAAVCVVLLAGCAMVACLIVSAAGSPS